MSKDNFLQEGSIVLVFTGDGKLKYLCVEGITFMYCLMYIEDIYSFAVNTINIVIECNEDISIFASAKHE